MKYFSEKTKRFYDDEKACVDAEAAFDEKVAKIDAWYDRHTRDYCICLLNKDGYEVRDCIRVGDKGTKNKVVAELKEEYNL